MEREGLKNVIFTNCVKDENIKQVGFSVLHSNLPLRDLEKTLQNVLCFHRGEFWRQPTDLLGFRGALEFWGALVSRCPEQMGLDSPMV